MDDIYKAKTVRLRSHHHKFLLAEEDEEHVTQSHKKLSPNARWTVELVPGLNNIIRLKSCYGKYLTASNQPLLLGMIGCKVVQSLPDRLDSSLEWQPIQDGNQIMFKTQYHHFLRANAGLKPWKNSVTHDIPQESTAYHWLLWDVDVVEVRENSIKSVYHRLMG